ncbi:protein kinase [Brachyspira pilosicoli]|uniref:protein kinase n=2 Tax=Brachyspira TaxID=29521 RepID=UPI0012F4D785|nr:protein kinase [Brachyspira pilosicoli]
MKKIISIILMISILSPLMAQNNYTFPEYMERLQRDVPKKAIQWFEENGYSDAYGVDKRIFVFYRGISRYHKYARYKGTIDDANRAASDFRQALEIPNDNVFYFNNRAMLYLGGLLATIPGDKELPARIFNYYIANTSPFDPDYPTSVYWALYLNYLDKETYNTYYNRLVSLQETQVYPVAIIYDYATATYKSIPEMLAKIPAPKDVKPNTYQWTQNGMNIYTLVSDSVPIIPEDKVLPTYGVQVSPSFEEYPPASRVPDPGDNRRRLIEEREVLEKIFTEKFYIETNETVTNDIITDDIFTNTVVTNEMINTNDIVTNDFITNEMVTNDMITNNTIETFSNVETYTLNVVVDKVNTYDNVRINIAGKEYNISNNSFTIDLPEGEYDVQIYVANKMYNNKVKVTKGYYNLLYIEVKEGKLVNNMNNQ